MKTVAGTPNSRDHTGARAPLLSHATARPQHAGTSFESQAQKGRQAVVKSQHAGTSQRYEPGSLPSRPGPQRLLTIGRVGARLFAVDHDAASLLTGSHPAHGKVTPARWVRGAATDCVGSPRPTTGKR